ncbi:MAG: long-chain fatty acid--CoA ligase [Deltaproteobacteria bacterium]|nr:long-chain fatty acid--CoA ligase [Deltaproteobacteria bacterium]
MSREQPLPKVFETVVHMLAEAAELSGGAPALVCEGRKLTYAEYLRCVAGFAHELRALGARGERVAIVCGNSIEIAVATFAVHAAGAQTVPLNPIYTARELRNILKDAEPTVVVYDPDVAATLEPVIAELRIPHGIKVGRNGGRLLDVWRDDGSVSLPQPLPSPEDLAALQYTGGTTGIPKGVNLTHRAVATNISQREASLPTREDAESILCMMPLFHVFAIAMCLHLAAYCRGKLVILPRYRPDSVLDTLEAERISVLPAGPTVFIGLMGYPGFKERDFSSLRACYSGSAPLPAETLKLWQELTGCPILEGFGQTEAGPVLTYVPEGGVIKPGSAGPVLPQTELQIVDVETGTKVLGIGEIGEIRARGPQLMSGYRNRPEETAAALRDGWLHTGDVGEFDADGYIWIRDRVKDMAIVGGYNVYPREIDEVLYAHPDVKEAAAVGVPDPYRGEVIKAFVVPNDGAALTGEAILTHCRSNLAKYKVPTSVEILTELPKTTVGKIDKKALRSARA